MCNFLLLHISHVELHVNVPIRGIYILPKFFLRWRELVLELVFPVIEEEEAQKGLAVR